MTVSREWAEAMVSVFGEAVQTGNLDLIDEYVAEDYVEHNPAPDQGPGLSGLKEMFGGFATGFPDLKTESQDIIIEGDKIVSRDTTTGTNTGEFMGMPATGKSVDFEEIHIGRVENGKMVEHWGLIDVAAMMTQLGMMPEPG